MLGHGRVAHEQLEKREIVLAPRLDPEFGLDS
jgi:hypothetical protein